MARLKSFRSVIISIFLALCFIAIFSTSAEAITLIQITPSKAKLSAFAGHSASGTIAVSSPSSKPVTVHVHPMDCDRNSNGGIRFHEAGSARSSCVNWIKINEKDLSLAGKDVKNVKFSIDVPSSAAPGYYQAVIFLEPTLKQNKAISANARAGAMIYLRVIDSRGAAGLKYPLADAAIAILIATSLVGLFGDSRLSILTLAKTFWENSLAFVLIILLIFGMVLPVICGFSIPEQALLSEARSVKSFGIGNVSTDTTNSINTSVDTVTGTNANTETGKSVDTHTIPNTEPPVTPLVNLKDVNLKLPLLDTITPGLIDTITPVSIDSTQGPESHSLIEIDANTANGQTFHAHLGSSEIHFLNKNDHKAWIQFCASDSSLAFALRCNGALHATRVNSDSLEFHINTDTVLNYTLEGDRVKERVILNRPPVEPSFEFDYREKGLVRKPSADGGFCYFGISGNELFHILPATVRDSSGVPGNIIMLIDGNRLILRVDPVYLMYASYPVTIDPTVVATGGNDLATAYPGGRRIVTLTDGTLVTLYTGNEADFSKGGYLVCYAYSKDKGVSWNKVSTGFYGKFPVFLRDDSNNLHVVYEKQLSPTDPNTGGIFYARATYGNDLNYSWSAPIRIDDAQDTHYHVPSIAADGNGTIHVVYDRHSAGDHAINRWHYIQGDNWGSSWNDFGDMTLNEFTSTETAGTFPSVVVDSDNDLYVTWNDGNGTFFVRRAVYSDGKHVWDNLPWAAFNDVGSRASVIPNAMMMHATIAKSGGGQIAIVLPNNRETDAYQYRLVISPTGTTPSWTNVMGINGSSPGDGWPALSDDGRGDYYILIKDSPSGYSDISYYKYAKGLQEKQVLFRDDNGMNSFPIVMGDTIADRLHVIWTSGSTQPFTVKYEYINTDPPPDKPTNLIQYEADHTTTITAGGTTTDGKITNLYFDMTMTGPNSTDTLTPKVEIEPVGQDFTNIPSFTGSSVPYNGSPVTGSVSINGLNADTSYHWQAWVTGKDGDSTRTSFGGNLETVADLTIQSYVSISISSTYNRDGSSGSGSTSFGSVSYLGSPFVIHTDANKYAVQLSLSSNTTWTVTVQSSSDLTATGARTIPIGQLKWRTHGSSDPWVAFQATSYTILSGQDPTSSATFRYDYQLNINKSDISGNYSTTNTYTMLSP